MKYCQITFRSVTPAQRAEGALRQAGISCAIRRTPRWMEEQGCGYSLHLRLADAIKAAELLRAKQIPFRKAYFQTEDGRTEELAL